MAAAALVAAGCDKKDQTPEEPAGLLKIEPLITRATSTNFEEGDKIGVDVILPDAAHATNECLTYSENEMAFQGTLKWYANGGTPCTIKAFYPYDAAGFPSTFTVASDQSTGAGASDFMVAAKTGVYPQKAAVTLPFQHYLSQIVVEVTNQAEADIDYVKVKGLIPTADINVEGEVITVTPSATAEKGDIIAEAVTANKTYRAIIVPQEAEFSLEIAVNQGATILTNIPSSIMKQGYTYKIEATVTPDNVKVSLAGEIKNWEDGGTIGGGSTEIVFEEHLDNGYFIYHNKNYKVAKLADGNWWMTQPLSYVPSDYTPSDDPTVEAHIWYSVPAKDDKDETKIEKYGYLYDYYAILDVKEITEDNFDDFAGVRGICPVGWHVPTKAEADVLVTGATSCYCDAALQYATTKIANADGFNYVLSGTRNKTTLTGNGSYLSTTISEVNAGDTGYAGEPSMNYIALSTGYQCKKNASGTITNYQFYGIMSTFSATTHGKLSVAYTNVCSGYQVRCVRDSAE